MDYAIEGYRIDLAKREISRHGTGVAIEPKVFDLLVHLVENRGRVVGKDELITQIWRGRAISDAALSSCVKAARRAVGDDGRQQRLIRTIHRHGFRFVATGVIEEGGPSDAAALREASRDDHGSLSLSDAPDLDLSLPTRPSVAVLPIQALGVESELLAYGFTHDLTARLARTRSLFVIARASAAPFANSSLDHSGIGERLGVRYLVGGTLMLVGRRLRMSIALTDTRRNCETWAENFDRTIDDIFAIQDEIGDYVAAVVEAEVERTEFRRAMSAPLQALDAWSAYHRARQHIYRFTAADCDQALHYLRIAATLAPDASRVFAGLSFIHWQRAFLDVASDRADAIADAFDCAHHSLALDPLDPHAHWALGRAYLLEGNVEASVEELRTAVELNPNFAVGHYSLAFGLSFGPDSARGFAEVAKARRLSPYDPMTYAFMAIRAALHGVHGEPEQASEWARRAVRQPNAHYHVQAIAGWCHQLAGEQAEARGCIVRLQTMRPHYSRKDYFQAFPFGPEPRAMIDAALAELGVAAE